MSCADRKRYFWTNIPQSDPPQQPVPANQFIEGNAKLVSNRITAPCAMASWRCEQCNNRHEPYCDDSHNHARHHYMYTGNPIRIQESGSYHGQRPSKPFLPSQLAKIGQRHVWADELEDFLGLKRHYTRVDKLADGSLIVVDNLNRLKCLGGGIDARQVSPLLAGLQQHRPLPVHTHVKPHEGWNTARMATWLTKGSLPVTPHGQGFGRMGTRLAHARRRQLGPMRH